MSQFSVLVVDDEAQMRELIIMYLIKEGYECVEAEDGEEALVRLAERRFDLLVLDVMMPNMDGLSVCMKVREKSDVPIIFVTARGDEWDKVNGLRIGADDYIVKPFSPRELVARIEALLRRTRRQADDIVRIGPLEMDIKGHKVRIDGADLFLTLKEFDLLACFTRHIGQVLSRDQLLEMVWGYEYYGNARTVDTHVKTLRMKLGEHAGLVQTVWGIGYKFEV
ncbi:DNA-binding response OmpR family regulator [Aneurinibacillus soli]|uniref:Transcriptional regulatory protein SrrA n=1 Tax=Aneurinibacillus soli TaxID=1500254 RepID=A0A0U4WGX0_9BACL|nr:response regulator transcription factor [Aneurinibacillus soli]PYE58199.1 DNA-binding response OmpR family regulator [Aneurinibacillus soli]BAU27915.1 Transcriptional regulatory protein SrrA [Aneurinibacillus soli]